MEGGFTSDALIDMSGGIEESFTLDKRASQKNKDDLWKILRKSRELKSMNAAYLEPDPYVTEEKLPNGLVKVQVHFRKNIFALFKVILLKNI